MSEYRLSLLESPPTEAFLTAQDHPDFEDIESRGRFAVGFLTAVVGMDDRTPFQWSLSLDDEGHFPIKNILIIWWDGEPFEGDILGFSGGQVRAGLNVVRVFESDDGGASPTYTLVPAADGIPRFEVDVNAQQSRSAPCAFPTDVHTETILPDAEGNSPIPRDLVEFDRLEDAEHVSCDYSGRTYQMPMQCDRQLQVICSDCRVSTVHVDPDHVPVGWPCLPTADDCVEDVDESSDRCVLGRIYACDDAGTPYVERQCEDGDYACDGDCVPVGQPDDSDPSSDTDS